jgi:hypothetical protein
VQNPKKNKKKLQRPTSQRLNEYSPDAAVVCAVVDDDWALQGNGAIIRLAAWPRRHCDRLVALGQGRGGGHYCSISSHG